MEISIVVATHSRPDGLEELLKSLVPASATPEMEWELIIVLNAVEGTDLSKFKDIIKSYSLPTKVIEEEVQGKCFALNKALGVARGTFIAFLDDDARVHKDYLTSIRSAICTNLANIYGGRVLPIWPITPSPWMTGGVELQSSRGPILVHDYGLTPREYGDGMVLPVGCNFFCRRDLFEKYTLSFDTRLGPGAGKGHMGGEEFKLLRELRARGERIFYMPTVAVDHPVEEERLTKRYFRYRMFCSGRSRPYLLEESCRRLFGIPRYIIRRIMHEFRLWIWNLCIGRRVAAFEHELNIVNDFGAIYEYMLIQNSNVS